MNLVALLPCVVVFGGLLLQCVLAAVDSLEDDSSPRVLGLRRGTR